ncbi:MAG: HAD hydrolase-like protein [Melioribacteraceae bacterium]|nr:HAD hydrolase-like protein [Melioribacteraceae bacterium]MCF8262950.1 HAD hydrolase-like protein [Melioribacteraceae bacterium]MCF8414349.1 HAD hydrolase-like protein [Melioribacteraceae bacterium]MCF8430617.1 HAD hydrolase-like protein [Melioribacteraceae bacterium]
MDSKYSVIVFDLGNVLIPFDYNIVIKKLDETDPGLGKRFYDVYMKNYGVYKKYERWQLSDRQFLDKMMEWTEGKIGREEFCKIYGNIFSVNQKVADLLPKLKENFTLVLLSNTCNIHQKYGWEKYTFLEIFDKWILSHEVGAVKPEEKIYKAVENFTGKPANEHFFIDDILEYVNAAKNNGWGGTQFFGYEQLIDSLQKERILP